MKWEHKCSLDWLKSRQRYITATDIKSLLPVTRTGRPRTVTDEDYLKVMSTKMVELTEEDCWSYGVMARGHILEPYAIKALNEMLVQRDGPDAEQFFWWDDEIVSLPGRSLAFSPDAMDIPMGNPALKPTAIAEVKSYSPDRHLAVAYSDKKDIEERWQIASAMALLDTIDHAYLVLFNPKMKFRRVFVIRFDRSDLEKEIETILEVERNWDDWKEFGMLGKQPPSGAVWSALGGSEENIIREVEEQRRLNP